MNPAEVVEREVQCERCPVILPFLAEAVRQSSESANRHAHCEVLALYVRRADSCRIGLADDWDDLRAHHFSGTVAVSAKESAEFLKVVALVFCDTERMVCVVGAGSMDFGAFLACRPLSFSVLPPYADNAQTPTFST
jgi:hypothetical protein